MVNEQRPTVELFVEMLEEQWLVEEEQNQKHRFEVNFILKGNILI